MRKHEIGWSVSGGMCRNANVIEYQKRLRTGPHKKKMDGEMTSLDLVMKNPSVGTMESGEEGEQSGGRRPARRLSSGNK